MTFDPVYTQKSAKQIEALDAPTQNYILKKIKKCAENPFLAKPLKNRFKHIRSERIEGYRILFFIENNTIIIVSVEKRKNVYH